MRDLGAGGRVGEFFRASVGAVVAGPDRLVLAVERADAPGEWQLPQGGIKTGETPEEAVRRELHEELALAESDVRLLAITRGWTSYVLPPTLSRRSKLGMGQTQRWFLFALEADPSRIHIDGRELSSWTWMPLAELSATTIGFRRPIYAELCSAFTPWVA